MTVLYETIFQRPPKTTREVTDQLRQAIDEGRLKHGDKLPTIRQIMAEAGLPYSTINRAISALASEGKLVSKKRGGTHVVAPQKPARPSGSARLNAYALVIPELNIGFYPNLVTSFETSAGKVGRRMIACASNNDVYKQGDIMVQIMTEGISGVALLPTTSGPPPRHQIEMLHNQGVPVVLLHRGVEGVEAPLLIYPAREIGEAAGRAMLQRGHEKIGFISFQQSAATMGYARGLRAAMGDVDVAWNEDWSYIGDIASATDVPKRFAPKLTEWLEKLLKSKDRPTAVFTSFMPVGEWVYVIASRLGIRVPEDLSIVTVGGQQRDGVIASELATVIVDESYTGSKSVELLGQMIDGHLPLDSPVSYKIQTGFDPATSLQDLT